MIFCANHGTHTNTGPLCFPLLTCTDEITHFLHLAALWSFTCSEGTMVLCIWLCILKLPFQSWQYVSHAGHSNPPTHPLSLHEHLSPQLSDTSRQLLPGENVTLFTNHLAERLLFYIQPEIVSGKKKTPLHEHTKQKLQLVYTLLKLLVCPHTFHTHDTWDTEQDIGSKKTCIGVRTMLKGLACLHCINTSPFLHCSFLKHWNPGIAIQVMLSWHNQ